MFAPLLLTDAPDALPKPLETYLLSVQPGFEGDPAQAVYNRVWVLGDDKTISVKAQGRLDEITELVPVQASRTTSTFLSIDRIPSVKSPQC